MVSGPLRRLGERPAGRFPARAATLVTWAWIAAAGCDAGVGDLPHVAMEGRDRDLVDHLAELRAAVRAQPNSGLLRGRMAMAFEANGFEDAALLTYRQAQSLDPHTFRWWYLRALLLAAKGRQTEALGDIDRAIALDSEYVPAWLWRGTWLLDEGSLDAAAEAYRRAAELGAGSPAALGAARVLLARGQAQDAVDILEPLASRTDHPHAHRLLGQAYRQLDRRWDARIALARGRNPVAMQWRDPRRGEKAQYIAGYGGRLVHGQNLLKAGRHDEALAILQALREREPDDVVLLSNLSLAYLRTGDADQALAVLRHGFEVAPDYYYFHLNIAALYRERAEGRADLELALSHLQQAARLKPELAATHEERGDLLARLDRADDALAAYDEALRRGSRNPQRVHYRAGLVEGARERWGPAVERFQRAVQTDESFTKAHIYLGRCLAEAGRFDEAEEALALAERLGPHATELAAAKRLLAALRKDAS